MHRVLSLLEYCTHPDLRKGVQYCLQYLFVVRSIGHSNSFWVLNILSCDAYMLTDNDLKQGFSTGFHSRYIVTIQLWTGCVVVMYIYVRGWWWRSSKRPLCPLPPPYPLRRHIWVRLVEGRRGDISFGYF